MRPACFKPTVEDPQDGQKFPPPEIPTNKLSHYVALSKLSKTKAIFVLEYDATGNTLKAMLHMWFSRRSAKCQRASLHSCENLMARKGHFATGPAFDRPAGDMKKKHDLTDSGLS